jgi:hypothetical protein
MKSLTLDIAEDSFLLAFLSCSHIRSLIREFRKNGREEKEKKDEKSSLNNFQLCSQR